MPEQTLTLGRRRFVLVPERDYLKLQKLAGRAAAKNTSARRVNAEFAEDAIRELRSYRKTRKAAKWAEVKAKLGL